MGPPWIITSSGGRSPSGAATLGVGRRVAAARGRSCPPAVGNAIGSGAGNQRGVEAEVARRHEHVDRAGVDVDRPTTCGSVGGAGRDAHRPRRRGRAARRTSVCGTSSGRDAPESGSRTASRSSPPSRERERDPPVGEERVAATGRTPTAGSRCPRRGRPSTSRPPAGVQRYRLQKPVRSPKNQSEPSGAHVGWPIDSRSSPPATTVRVAALVDHQPGGVPRHVRVVPLEPAERRAVGAPARVGHEVGPLDHHLGRARLVGGEPHDRVGGLAPVGVVLLLDAEQRGAVGAAGRRRRSAGPRGTSGSGVSATGLAAGLEPVEPLRGPVGEPQHAVAHPPRAAAVLVHGGAGAVLGAGSTSSTRAVGAAAQHRDAAALLGAALGPPHVVAVDAHAVGQARRPHDQLARDRRRPRPVGQGRGHGGYFASASRSAMRRQPSPRSSSPRA